MDCGGVLHTLLERGLIRILGRRDVVGRPIVYGTTPLFLEHFGFKSLSDMPKPEEFETTERLDWEPAGGQEEVLALEAEAGDAAVERSCKRPRERTYERPCKRPGGRRRAGCAPEQSEASPPNAQADNDPEKKAETTP